MQNKDSLDLDYQQFKKIDDSCFHFVFALNSQLPSLKAGFRRRFSLPIAVSFRRTDRSPTQIRSWLRFISSARRICKSHRRFRCENERVPRLRRRF